MLRELRIFNFILIETSVIPFEKGLNVITGETGSGKSAIIHALSFITGARSDVTLIRKGCDKGAVEASFEIDNPQIIDLLTSAGIEHEIGNELIIRREITVGGKSRAFINNQMLQLSLLKSIGELLLGLLGQHANQLLMSTSYHRHLVNVYGRLEAATIAFGKAWQEENHLKDRLEKLKNSEAERLRLIEAHTRELQELNEAALKEGEEEDLFAEYTLLANSEELTTKTNTLVQGSNALLPALQRQQKVLQELASIDNSLADSAEALSNAYVEIQEVARTLSIYQSRIEYDPIKLEKINDRLKLINHLKKRYGISVEEIENYRNETAKKLETLENADLEIEQLGLQLDKKREVNDSLARELTEKRKSSAAKFQTAIAKQLRYLNMPKVEFHVDISSQKRDSSGEDSVEFFLKPNVGEHKMPLKSCASGGELSRVLLALHTILAGKDGTPTLVFDEIDSNIGGETATVIGEKLREISTNQQVICITHFPQVAKQANLHHQISKMEKSGRTITIVQQLDDISRQKELARMLGGNCDLLDAMALLR